MCASVFACAKVVDAPKFLYVPRFLDAPMFYYLPRFLDVPMFLYTPRFLDAPMFLYIFAGVKILCILPSFLFSMRQ